jgi:predicted DNA-binding ribbon-helix-helix protein
MPRPYADALHHRQMAGFAAAARVGSPLSGLRKRSVSLSGHATSLALEPEFWAVLDQMAAARGVSVGRLIAGLDRDRGERPLASACRVAALAWAGAQGAGRTRGGDDAG